MSPPVIWFERPPVPGTEETVAANATVMMGTADARWQGLDRAEGIIAGAYKYTAEVIAAAPRLLAIGRTGIGVDSVDLEAATARGVAVMNVPDGPTTSTAEHAVALIMAVAKCLKSAEQRLIEQTGEYYHHHRAVELDGKTLGLLGIGRIARQVAGVGTQLGMKVVAFDPFVAASRFPPGVEKVDSLEAILSQSDVVSVHVPLTPETHHLIDADALAKMQQGAVLVNTARGGLVDTDALLAALDSGHLLGAGLDVTDPEPLPAGHPLLGRSDVVVTPHVASGTPEARRRNLLGAFEQVMQVLRGERPDHLVNPAAWDRVLERLG